MLKKKIQRKTNKIKKKSIFELLVSSPEFFANKAAEPSEWVTRKRCVLK